MTQKLRPVFLILTIMFFVWAFPANLSCAFQVQDDVPKAFYHDFRGHPLPAELTLYQVQDENLLQVEPQGTRIRIPKTWIHPWGGVGVKTTFGLKGNFEVTATVEILEAETPKDGFGVGVCLYVSALGDKDTGASAARLVKANGNQLVLWDLTHDSPAQSGESPCTDKVGRLRLLRMGTTLYYLWAPGIEGNDFKIFHQMEFGNTDIKYVRLGALNGRTPSNVDVRLLDLAIQDQMTTASVTNVRMSSSRGWLAAALFIVLVIAMSLALGVWLHARRRRRADQVQVKDEV